MSQNYLLLYYSEDIVLKKLFLIGQEDTSVDVEDGIRFTPFNMKEELEEGHFDSEGTYIFRKEKVITHICLTQHYH